jgi:DNA-binding MarR family transcriptional regulator
VGVEEEIAKGLESRLGTFIKRAEQAMMAEKSRVLRPLGLTVPQYAALNALANAPLSGAQLARLCYVTPQSMASLLAHLEAKQLVERTPSEVHAQVLVAKLTRRGRALYEKANTAALEVEGRMSAAFGAEEEKALREGLRRVVTALTTD